MGVHGQVVAVPPLVSVRKVENAGNVPPGFYETRHLHIFVCCFQEERWGGSVGQGSGCVCVYVNVCVAIDHVTGDLNF